MGKPGRIAGDGRGLRVVSVRLDERTVEVARARGERLGLSYVTLLREACERGLRDLDRAFGDPKMEMGDGYPVRQVAREWIPEPEDEGRDI